MRRLFCLTLLCGVVAAGGCNTTPETEKEPVWEQAKIGDLAAPYEDGSRQARFLATANLEVQVMDLPTENVERLDPVWEVLSSKPIRTNSYNAFSKNSFRVKFSRVEEWPKIHNLLTEAGAQKNVGISMVLADNTTSDLPVADVPPDRMISFYDSNLEKQTVTLGPGILALRLTCEPIPWARGVRKVIAYPAFTLPVKSAIEEFEWSAQKQDYMFASAAFAAQMGPGDLVVLGPEEYTGEQISLGGLFFNKPTGSLFFNPATRKPPVRKPAVRIYILLCTNISG